MHKQQVVNGRSSGSNRWRYHILVPYFWPFFVGIFLKHRPNIWALGQLGQKLCPGRMEPQAAKAPPETELEDLFDRSLEVELFIKCYIRVIVIHYNYMCFFSRCVGFVGCKSARRSNFNSCRMKLDLLDSLKLLSRSIHFHPFPSPYLGCGDESRAQQGCEATRIWVVRFC